MIPIKKFHCLATLFSVSLLISGLTGLKATVLTHSFLDATGGCIIQAHVGDQVQIQLDSSLDLYGLYAENSYSHPLSEENFFLPFSTAYTIKYLKQADIDQDTDIPIGSDDPYFPALSIISNITQISMPSGYSGIGMSNTIRSCKLTYINFSCDAPGRTMIKCKKLQTCSTFYEDILTFIIQIDPVSPPPSKHKNKGRYSLKDN